MSPEFSLPTVMYDMGTPLYFVKFEICSVRFLTESALWSAVQTPIRIKTSREAQSHCAKTESNAYARTDQCAERLKMHESRESQMLQLSLERIVTKIP